VKTATVGGIEGFPTGIGLLCDSCGATLGGEQINPQALYGTQKTLCARRLGNSGGPVH